MANSVSNQTVVVLALVLVLLVIGGTFLVMQEVRSLKQPTAVMPPLPRTDSSTGVVFVYVMPQVPPE